MFASWLTFLNHVLNHVQPRAANLTQRPPGASVHVLLVFLKMRAVKIIKGLSNKTYHKRPVGSWVKNAKNIPKMMDLK